MVRKHIVFSGRVQGVGFRYTAAWLAREQGLTGWVRNLSDGNVEMEIQGSETDIGNLLARLSSDSYIHIENMEIDECALRLNEAKFQTKFTY